MNEAISSILLVTTICFNPILARPELLKQQRYEFQEFHTSSSNDHNARLEVATIPVHQEPILWSQQHQNEVNAFAEMFRQTYNQMIEQHNERMQMAYHAVANPFMPVTYVLYDVPNESFWKNYFGNQQQYVYHQTEQMSRQLIQELEQGRVSPQELMNPNFFVAQAANELNRVHHAHNEFGSNDQQVATSSINTYQQHHFDTFDDQQQQQHQIFAETHHLAENSEQVQEYNQKAGEYQFVTVVAASEKPQNEELAGEMTSNANVQHLSYIQRLPPVTFNNENLNRFNQEVEQKEVYTSVSPRISQQHLNEEVNKPLETAVDEFYGSTYDQQPIYDMQFVESVSSTVKPSMANVMSLVRNKPKVKPSTTTSAPSTTTSNTTELPTTESSIMSLLPNKKPSFNYTDIAHKVRAELDKQMKNIHNNKSEETHFMGMTSNIDHVKLSYDTIIDAKDHKESRGDQPSKTDDYIYEEYVESGTYSVNTKPEPELVVSTVSVKSSTTPSPITSTATPIRVYPNPFHPTPSIPFPTTTTKPPNPYYSAPLAPFPDNPNPYYSAPLAPFPDNIFQVQATAQSQVEHLEHSDTPHETHVIDHSNGSHFVVAATNQELNEQQYVDIFENQEEFQRSHDMQQYVDVQQTYIDIAGGHEMERQRYEQQLPPEQLYRDPYLQHSVGFNDNSKRAHVQEITETPATVEHKTQKNNWFQQKLSKIKNLF